MPTYVNYSYPNMTGSTGGLSYPFQYANNVTGGGVGVGIILGTFFIAILSLLGRGYPLKRIAAPVLFVTTLVGILLRTLSMVVDQIILALIVLTVLATAWLFVED